MPYAIGTRKLKARHTAAIRLTTPPSEIGSAFERVLGEVLSYLDEVGVRPAGPPFARYFDFSAEEADLEIGFPVRNRVSGTERIAGGELPGGLAAVTVHQGSYDGLERAHDEIGHWVLARGHDPAGPVWEVYRTDPREEPNQARWETEVIWPLRR